MMVLEANQHHAVALDKNNNIFVTLKSENPVSGEIEPSIGFALSPHNALWLAEMIKQEAEQAIASGDTNKHQAMLLPFTKQ